MANIYTNNEFDTFKSSLWVAALKYHPRSIFGVLIFCSIMVGVPALAAYCSYEEENNLIISIFSEMFLIFGYGFLGYKLGKLVSRKDYLKVEALQYLVYRHKHHNLIKDLNAEDLFLNNSVYELINTHIQTISPHLVKPETVKIKKTDLKKINKERELEQRKNAYTQAVAQKEKILLKENLDLNVIKDSKKQIL